MLDDHRAFARRWLPVKILAVGGSVALCAWLFVEFVCIETTPALECVGIGAVLITLISFVTKFVWTWESSHIRYGSRHCEIFRINLDTLHGKIDKGLRFGLLLRPFEPEAKRVNFALLKKQQSERLERRLRTINQMRDLPEQSIALALSDTATVALYNEAFPINHHLLYVPGGDDWVPFFQLLALESTYIVLMIERRLNDNLLQEIGFIEQQDLGDRTLVVDQDDSDLPFTPRWILRGNIKEQSQLPGDFQDLIAD